jgi:hypothetical protein
MYTKQSWKYINMVSNESLYYDLSIEYKIYTLYGYQILSDVKKLKNHVKICKIENIPFFKYFDHKNHFIKDY